MQKIQENGYKCKIKQVLKKCNQMQIKTNKLQKSKTILKLQKIEKLKMQEIQPSRIYQHFVLVLDFFNQISIYNR